MSPLVTAIPAWACYDQLTQAATAPRQGEYRDALSAQLDHFAQFDQKLTILEGPTGPWSARGWDRPNAAAIEAARAALFTLRDLNLVPDSILATAKGGIGIRFTRGARYGSLEFLNSGDVVQLRMGGGSPEATPVRTDGTVGALVDLRLFLNC